MKSSRRDSRRLKPFTNSGKFRHEVVLSEKMFGLKRFESLRLSFYCRSIRQSGCGGVSFPFETLKSPMKKLLPLIAFAALVGSPVYAQQQPLQLKLGDVSIGKLEPEVQKTPFFEAGLVKVKDVPNPRDWLELEAEFEVKGPRDAVVKELLFRYYIGFKDQKGQSITLTGDVKHVNVVVGEKSYSAVYVAPSTLGEITGDFRRFQPSAVQAVGLEVFYNGVMVGGESSTKSKFWEAIPSRPGVLPKADTPFATLWIDRYSETEKANP
jgi:hypothetical protein